MTCGRSLVFSGNPVSSTNNTGFHDITEILLKVVPKLMAYRRVRSYGNTMGATRGTETANSSRAPEYTSGCLLPVVTLTCSRVVAHYGSLFSSVFLSWWRKQTLQGVRDNASALLCCLPGDVNTFVNLIKACSHSSFHRNIEPFSHSLCNGLAMIANFFTYFL